MSDPSERSSHQEAAVPAQTDVGAGHGDSALVQRLWRRSTSPGVVPLRQTIAISRRAEQFGAGRLPLLERVQRWRTPVESGGPEPVGPLVQVTRPAEPVEPSSSAPDSSGRPGPNPLSPAPPSGPSSPMPTVRGTAVQRTPSLSLPLGKVEPVMRSNEVTAIRSMPEPTNTAGGRLPNANSVPRSAPASAPAAPDDISVPAVVRPDQPPVSEIAEPGSPIVQRQRSGQPGSAAPVVPPSHTSISEAPEIGPPIVQRQASARSGRTSPMQATIGTTEAPPSNRSIEPPDAISAGSARGADAPTPGPLPLGRPTASVQRQPPPTPGDARPSAQPSLTWTSPPWPGSSATSSVPSPGAARPGEPPLASSPLSPLPPVSRSPLQPPPTEPVMVSRAVTPAPSTGIPVLARTSLPVLRTASASTAPAPSSEHAIASPSALPVARSGQPSVSVARAIDDGIAPATSLPSVQTRSSEPEKGVSSPASSGQVTGAAPPAPPAAPDLDDLVDRVLHKLMRQLAVERERRGRPRWI